MWQFGRLLPQVPALAVAQLRFVLLAAVLSGPAARVYRA